MAVKTYVLLENMDAEAKIYQTTADGQRIQVKKMPFHRPTLRQTFYTPEGVSKTIRYKLGATDASGKSVIDQREQMDRLKIEANDPFTQQERRDLMFRHGVLTTNKLIAQDYLEAHPECLGFEGTCDDVREPRYKLLDNVATAKIKNNDMRLRVKAANKILDLNLEEAQATLIRLNGSFFTTPTDLEDCQNLLMEFVDDAEEAGLKAVLKEDSETTVDEKTTVLIGSLLNANILSFNAINGNISKKDKDGKWMAIRSISSEHSLEEKVRLFSDFLNDEGKTLRFDLEKDLKNISKKIK